MCLGSFLYLQPPWFPYPSCLVSIRYQAFLWLLSPVAIPIYNVPNSCYIVFWCSFLKKKAKYPYANPEISDQRCCISYLLHIDQALLVYFSWPREINGTTSSNGMSLSTRYCLQTLHPPRKLCSGTFHLRIHTHFFTSNFVILEEELNK